MYPQDPKPTGPLEELTVYDLIPDFGSYIADVESNIQWDPNEWREYLNDPTPYIVDLLSDFGNFPEGIEGQAAVDLAEKIAKKYVGN